MKRQLILTAYDVSNPHRLRAARASVSDWAHGGQKSVWECFAGHAERTNLSMTMCGPLDPASDRLAFFVPPARATLLLGRARAALDSPLIFIG